jgi:hypothetical protein
MIQVPVMGGMEPYKRVSARGRICGAALPREVWVGSRRTRLPVNAVANKLPGLLAAYFTVSLLCPNKTRRDSASLTAGTVLIAFPIS